MTLSDWSRIRQSKAFVAFFIVANALTAGSIFCFPLFGTTIATDLGLSLTQTNTIWSAAVVGQYASAAVFGNIADKYGPRLLSLLAAALFGGGYILMAHTESNAILHKINHVQVSEETHRANFFAMSAYFLLVGAGVAASIFSALRASTSHFKSHPGLALSIPLTLFSLSSLFLTLFASLPFFTDPKTGDLNGPKWLAWLGAALMITNALSAFGLSVPLNETQVSVHDHRTDDSRERNLDFVTTESTPLLTPKPRQHALRYSVPYYKDANQCSIEPVLSLREYIFSPAVWMLAFSVFAAVGGAEMVMSSIGSMVVSLRANLPTSTSNEDDKIRLGRETLALRAQQVQYLAVANTLARLLVGVVSDQFSPRPSTVSTSATGNRPRSKFEVSRLTMLIGGLALLLVSYVYAATFLDKVEHLWFVSVATGLGYGLTFTLVPSMVVVLWPKQFGRNYGLLTYAAAIGSLCFSIVFAQINDSVAQRNNTVPHLVSNFSKSSASLPNASICVYGRACFATSFMLAAATVGIAIGVVFPLWRAWRTLL